MPKSKNDQSTTPRNFSLIGFVLAASIILLLFVPLINLQWSVSRLNGEVVISAKVMNITKIKEERRLSESALEIERIAPSVVAGPDYLVAKSEWDSVVSYFYGGNSFFESGDATGDYYATAYHILYKIKMPDDWKKIKISELRSISDQIRLSMFTDNLAQKYKDSLNKNRVR